MADAVLSRRAMLRALSATATTSVVASAALASPEPVAAALNDEEGFEEFAARTFEPWSVNGPFPLFNVERWDQLGETHAMILNTAFVLYHKTKAELMESVRSFDRSGEQDVFFNLIEHLAETHKTLTEMAAMCQSAEIRLMASAAAVEVGISDA